jgi:hypothetical protein
MLTPVLNCSNEQTIGLSFSREIKMAGNISCPEVAPDNSFGTMNITVMAMVLIVIFIASVAGNSCVFIVFYKRPSLLTLSNRFILNLTVCNSLNTVFVMPFMLVSIISHDWAFGESWCHVTGFVMNTAFAASTLSLVVICIDRYCAVVVPLHYTMLITSRRTVAMMLAVWTVAIFASIPPLLGWNHFVYQYDKTLCTVLWSTSITKDRYYTLFLVTLCFILPLFVMLWAYSVIFRAARNNSERTRRASIIPTHSNLPDIDAQTAHTPLKLGRRRSSSAPILIRRISSASRTSTMLWRRDEWKAAVTSMILVSAFVVCWLPYFIIIVLESVLPEPTSIHHIVETISILLAMSSCACNPMVYVFRNKVTRRELRSILGFPVVRDVSFSRRTSMTPADQNGSIGQTTQPVMPVIHEKPTQVIVTVPSCLTSNACNSTTTLTSFVKVDSSSSLQL